MSRVESEKLNRMMFAAALSRAICTVAELGVADHIPAGSPTPIADLAEKTGAHERSLYRILRFLASKGIFVEKELGLFGHTDLSRQLRDDTPDTFRPTARMFHRMSKAWDEMPHTVATGEPGFNKAYGKPVFEYIAGDPELPAIFDAGMTAGHGHETKAMLDAYSFESINVVADIGGGNGSLIGAVLQRYPNMNGVLFDLDHVTNRARGNLEAMGLTDRCKVVAGSFFESIPAGADAYILRHIIHDWNDHQSAAILNNARAVVPDHGRVLLVECVVPSGNDDCFVKDIDMCMLMIPGGVERTESEYAELLSGCGFKLQSVTPTDSPVSVIEARPA